MIYTFIDSNSNTTVDVSADDFDSFRAKYPLWTYKSKEPKAPQIQTLAEHLQEVEEATDLLIKRTLQEYNYISIGEAASIALLPLSVWHDEALSICEWHNNVYEFMYSYFEAAETQHKTVEQYLSELPNFEFQNQTENDSYD
jgi:3-methyladenine DNA glycosylase Tag